MEESTSANAAPEYFIKIEIRAAVLVYYTPGYHRPKLGNTDYVITTRTNLPAFKENEFRVRRRFSDFEWLTDELEQDSRINVPCLPEKGWTGQKFYLPMEGITEEDFIRSRLMGLKTFMNTVTSQPLALQEKCLHMFLQEPAIDKDYVPGKIDPPYDLVSP